MGNNKVTQNRGGITMGKCKNDAYRTESNGSKTSKVEMFNWKILDKPGAPINEAILRNFHVWFMS